MLGRSLAPNAAEAARRAPRLWSFSEIRVWSGLDGQPASGAADLAQSKDPERRGPDFTPMRHWITSFRWLTTPLTCGDSLKSQGDIAPHPMGRTACCARHQ